MISGLNISVKKFAIISGVLLTIYAVIFAFVLTSFMPFILPNNAQNNQYEEIITRLDRLYNATVAYQTRCEELGYPYSIMMRISEAYDKSYSLDDFIRRLTNIYNEATATELTSELSKKIVYELGQLIEKLNNGAYIEAAVHLNNMWRLIAHRAVVLGCPLS